MRFIVADLFKQNCKITGSFENHFQGVDLYTLGELIDKQPSACDPDKVVEQFYEKQNESRYIHRQDDWNNGIGQAIDIVKAGGI